MKHRKRVERGGAGKILLSKTETVDFNESNASSRHNNTNSFSRSKMVNAPLPSDGSTSKKKPKSSSAAYQAATELLRSFTERRVLYDRGATVAEEMNGMVRSIADAEDAKKYRLFLPSGNDFSGDDGDMQENVKEEVAEASQKLLASRSIGSPHPESEKSGMQSRSGFDLEDDPLMVDGGNNAIALKPMGEEEKLEAAVIAKQDKLEQLRSFQRAMAEIMDQFEEERQSREALVATGHQDATSDEYERKAIQRANRVQEAMRSNFEALIADSEDVEVPPDLSSAFSIQNLSSGMELLGKSIATMVEATDEICVTATFKTEGEPASLFLCVKALRTHVPYSKKAHEQILNHMTHYELGEQAILEDGTAEINRLRESFLQCKDRLILEEQRLKSAEEHRESLRKRLLSTHQRCDMWEAMLLQRDAPRIYMEMMNHTDAETDVEETVEVIPGSYAKSAASPTSSSTLRSTMGSPNPSVPTQQETLPKSLANPLSARRFTRTMESTVDTALEDTYESQVAASWGNPYVNKAKQYEMACVNGLASMWGDRSVLMFNPAHLNSANLDSLQTDASQLTSDGKRCTKQEEDEILFTSHARRLALLQSLFRTIPATTFVEMPGNKSKSSFSGESSKSNTILETDEQLRKETRTSIQRLIRYTTQSLHSRPKD